MTAEDEDMDALIKAIGKQLDNFVLIMKDTKNIYAMEYQLNKLPSDYVLDRFIESLGFSSVYKMVERNLIDFFAATTSTWLTKQQIARYFKAAFINNIQYVIKTKGTKEAVLALENVFG